MQKTLTVLALAFLLQLNPPRATGQTQPAKAPYATMAPFADYLIPNEASEIALARSAAPKSISGAAEILVLGRNGYTTAVKGSNGFLCMVQRGWSGDTGFSDFWNPKLLAPICFNPAATRDYASLILMKTRLVLAGETKAQIAKAVASALDSKQIPPMEPGAMAYMMSKQQYLGDQNRQWRPHLMFFIPGRALKTWGDDLPGSPVMAAADPEERITMFFVLTSKWSDGTPAPPVP
jgi:hypothetical protein